MISVPVLSRSYHIFLAAPNDFGFQRQPSGSRAAAPSSHQHGGAAATPEEEPRPAARCKPLLARNQMGAIFKMDFLVGQVNIVHRLQPQLNLISAGELPD